MRRIRLIDWGALAAVAVGSLGCMGGGGSPLASQAPAGTSQTFAQQTAPAGGQTAGTFSQSAAAGAAGISRALWDNPVSRAVKGAFTSEADTIAQVQTPTMSASDPLSLSNTGKPPSPDLYTSMGLMAERAGNMDKAREFYEQAIATAPADADALLACGHFHDRQGRLDQATRLYLDAIHADPQHAGAHNDLGLCYARQGQLPQALELVRRAAKLRPDRPIYRNNVAKVLVEMGRGDEAVTELAAVLAPAEAQYNVGCFLAQAGQHQEAAGHFAAAVQIDPTMENARAWLARLQPGTVDPQQSAAARMSSRHAPGAAMARTDAGTPYGQQATSSATADHRLPLITNVRPANAEEDDYSAVSPLPQASARRLPPQQASYADSSPYAGTSPGTLPARSAAWPESQPSPYLNTSDNRYQTPNGVAEQSWPHGTGDPLGPARQPTSGTSFDGASHASPWGSIPSPYHGSSLDTPQHYQSTPTGGQHATAAAPQRAAPTTMVNPYATTPHAASPWDQQRTVRQASAATMR